MKEAMWLVTKQCISGSLKGCFPIINMHDELVVEVPENEDMWEKAALIGHLMELGMSKVLPDVKITAEPEIKRRWTKTAARLVPCGQN